MKIDEKFQRRVEKKNERNEIKFQVAGKIFIPVTFEDCEKEIIPSDYREEHEIFGKAYEQALYRLNLIPANLTINEFLEKK